LGVVEAAEIEFLMAVVVLGVAELLQVIFARMWISDSWCFQAAPNVN
jgi:hypothetical protein